MGVGSPESIAEPMFVRARGSGGGLGMQVRALDSSPAAGIAAGTHGSTAMLGKPKNDEHQRYANRLRDGLSQQ
jgi:hypothetical protein